MVSTGQRGRIPIRENKKAHCKLWLSNKRLGIDGSGTSLGSDAKNDSGITDVTNIDLSAADEGDGRGGSCRARETGRSLRPILWNEIVRQFCQCAFELRHSEFRDSNLALSTWPGASEHIPREWPSTLTRRRRPRTTSVSR